MSGQTPVLVVSFNRPERTSEVLRSLESYAPRTLYFAVDGPRDDRPGEAESVQHVQELAASIPWDCNVRTLCRGENLGCRLAVSGAVDWFLSAEPEGIIIEDDALTDPSFFGFADELLDRYREDDSVISICGEAFAPAEAISTDASYRFTRLAASKAWATWRHSWQGYTPDLRGWRDRLDRRQLTDALGGNRLAAAYWSVMFDQVASGRVDSWAYGLMYLGLRRRQLTAVPNGNLVTDMGVGPGATHTTRHHSYHLAATPIDLPLRHPRQVSVDESADAWSQRNELGLNPKGLIRGAGRYAQIRMRSGRE